MDAERLRDLIGRTPWIIEQYRARIIPADYSYSDDIFAPGGFGPKSPGNDNMIMLADAEAQALGNLAAYCMDMGSIGRKPLTAFWWSNGRCLGLSTKCGENYEKLWEIVYHLKAHAPEILDTEGTGEYIEAIDEIRVIAETILPHEMNEDTMLTREEAAKYTGRSERTIRHWVDSGTLPHSSGHWGKLYSKKGLDLKMAIIHANRLRGAKGLNAEK